MNGHEKIRNESKQMVIASMLELMKKKPYNDITISQISDHAKLSRRTFYRIFKEKDDILNEICDDLCKEYINHVQNFMDTSQVHCCSIQSVAMIYFSFFEKHYDLVKLFQKNHLEYYLLILHNHYVPILIEQLHKVQIPDDYHNPIRIITLYNAGGLFNILLYWIEKDIKISAVEIEKTLQATFLSLNENSILNKLS
jgi:AcrR family transcriptional regulator